MPERVLKTSRRTPPTRNPRTIRPSRSSRWESHRDRACQHISRGPIRPRRTAKGPSPTACPTRVFPPPPWQGVPVDRRSGKRHRPRSRSSSGHLVDPVTLFFFPAPKYRLSGTHATETPTSRAHPRAEPATLSRHRRDEGWDSETAGGRWTGVPGTRCRGPAGPSRGAVGAPPGRSAGPPTRSGNPGPGGPLARPARSQVPVSPRPTAPPRKPAGVAGPGARGTPGPARPPARFPSAPDHGSKAPMPRRRDRPTRPGGPLANPGSCRSGPAPRSAPLRNLEATVPSAGGTPVDAPGQPAPRAPPGSGGSAASPVSLQVQAPPPAPPCGGTMAAGRNPIVTPTFWNATSGSATGSLSSLRRRSSRRAPS